MEAVPLKYYGSYLQLDFSIIALNLRGSEH